MDVGFLILSPDRNVAGLRNTIGSIKNNSYNRESLCVVGETANADDLKEMREYCPTYKGKDTITSLVNVGMKKLKHEWAFVLFGGSRIPTYLERKFEAFCKSEKDVLFPVVDGKYDFIEGSFNGVMINTRFFQHVGDFPTTTMQKYGMTDFELAKMFWAVDAAEHGVQFKAIVGMKII